MWFYNNQEFTEEMIGDAVGFVYLITNLSNNKKYLGKKSFTKSKSYQKNKKKKKKRVGSDWLSYYGSNKELQEDVATHGAPNNTFKREILKLCYSKSEMSYFETKYIFEYDCLLSDAWYNSWVSCRINGNTLGSIKHD